jgi:hypothetical protein
VENYFNYFTEIEEHFQKRRGTGLLLSTLDWALIETWKDAGVPLEAVLRGIDNAFEKHEQRRSKTQKVNSLAYCSQAVLSAAEEMKEAAVGAQRDDQPGRTLGFEADTIAAFFRQNAASLLHAQLPLSGAIPVRPMAEESAGVLRQLADELQNGTTYRLEDLERRMTVLEEKLFAVLLAATADEELVAVRAQADRELAPYRSKMPGPQIDQLHKQYVNKRLIEKYGFPRLSLFYM